MPEICQNIYLVTQSIIKPRDKKPFSDAVYDVLRDGQSKSPQEIVALTGCTPKQLGLAIHHIRLKLMGEGKIIQTKHKTVITEYKIGKRGKSLTPDKQYPILDSLIDLLTDTEPMPLADIMERLDCPKHTIGRALFAARRSNNKRYDKIQAKRIEGKWNYYLSSQPRIGRTVNKLTETAQRLIRYMHKSRVDRCSDRDLMAICDFTDKSRLTNLIADINAKTSLYGYKIERDETKHYRLKEIGNVKVRGRQ